MSDKYDTVDVTGVDSDMQKVLKHQSNEATDLNERLSRGEKTLDATISESERILRRLQRPVPKREPARSPSELALPAVRPWSQMLSEAENDISSEISLADLLTEAEMSDAESGIAILREEFDAQHRLDGIDWAISGVAGTLAALVDTFLIKMPSSPGYLGSKKTQGGALSDYIRDRLKSAHTPEEIAALEKKYGVPYDIPHSSKLGKKVSGLGPKTHRFQSLGHDPILGFIFGVSDILRGKMTAVDASGRLIIQKVGASNPGMSIFEAIAHQFGHLKSDISTKAGLPAPLMPLLQFIQVGHFGKGDRTVGEIARLMYVKGYDFGHFLAMSVPVLLIEVIVRVAYCVKRLKEGHDLAGALPLNLPGKPHQPKLQTMLFTAHLISTAVNGTRAYLTSNPLAINYPQWIMFAKSSFQQCRWVLFKKEQERLAHTQAKMDNEWEVLNKDLSAWWDNDEVGSDVLSLPASQ
ncbi:MAG TPA: hypothetical protein PLI51_02375 [bacterium]|nr:hypothetical protein [bacterium]HPQ65561.1 hypothetical protein [bacterium]